MSITSTNLPDEYESWQELAKTYPFAKLNLDNLTADEAACILSEMEALRPVEPTSKTGGAGQMDESVVPLFSGEEDFALHAFVSGNLPRLRSHIDPVAGFALAIISGALRYEVQDITKVFGAINDVEAVKRARRIAPEDITFSDAGETSIYAAMKGGGLTWDFLSNEHCAAQYLVADEDLRLARAADDIDAVIEAADRRGQYRARLEHIRAFSILGKKHKSLPEGLEDFVMMRYSKLKDLPPDSNVTNRKKRTTTSTAAQIFYEIVDRPESPFRAKNSRQILDIIRKYEKKY